MKAVQGVKESMRLQRNLQQDQTEPVRGVREDDNHQPVALNSFLYSLVRSSRAYRRAFIMSLLKQFDETMVSKSDSFPVLKTVKRISNLVFLYTLY